MSRYANLEISASKADQVPCNSLLAPSHAGNIVTNTMMEQMWDALDHEGTLTARQLQQRLPILSGVNIKTIQNVLCHVKRESMDEDEEEDVKPRPTFVDKPMHSIKMWAYEKKLVYKDMSTPELDRLINTIDRYWYFRDDPAVKAGLVAKMPWWVSATIDLYNN